MRIRKKLDHRPLCVDVMPWLTEPEAAQARKLLYEVALCGAPLCEMRLPEATYARVMAAASGGSKRPVVPTLFGAEVAPTMQDRIEGSVEAVPL